MKRKILHCGAGLARQSVRHGQNRPIRLGFGARRRGSALEILRDHGQGALRQIAEIIGEIGIDAARDRLVRVIAVLAERDFTQKKIA